MQKLEKPENAGKGDSMKVPVIRMNEHNEAYLIWHQMIKRGYISETGNYLLHVDHHNDTEIGGYAWDLNKRPKTDEEIHRFTYHVLGIADFIMPAAYYGVFSDVHILKNVLPQKIMSSEEFLRIIENCELQRGKYIPFLHASYKDKADSEYHFFNYHEGGLLDKETFLSLIEGKDVVLDVDLDYFCWDDSLRSVGPKRIEITKEAYEECVGNVYHPYRILPKRMLEVVEDQGKYYLEYKEYGRSYPMPTRERIEKRMDKLIQWFRECDFKPAAIDICSSHFSGYLPKDVYPWIEERFLEKLSELWEIENV